MKTKLEIKHSLMRLRTTLLLCVMMCSPAGIATQQGDSRQIGRGSQFIGFTDLENFIETNDTHTGKAALMSPPIAARMQWDELIPSWNVAAWFSNSLSIEVRALYPDRGTKWYSFGQWSPAPLLHPSTSFANQLDANGDVATDTLRLREPCQNFQIRCISTGRDPLKSALEFVGISLVNSSRRPPKFEPNTNAWEITLPVPERSQMVYTNGAVLCSPATVSMLMGFWASQLRRPELDIEVPEIARKVFDQEWGGTGNWSFNMAFPGAQPGLLSYVSRFSDLSELEDWITAGIPVGLSVCYNRLRGQDGGRSGHLVVCVGFTERGDVVVNDPGTTKNVRKTFPRENVIHAWAHSLNTVYLVYPRDYHLPRDRFGNWHTSND